MPRPSGIATTSADQRDHSVPWISGRIPNSGSANSGDHVVAGQELLDVTALVAEERDRLAEQRGDDADRDQDRRRRGEEQQRADQLLAVVPLGGAEHLLGTRRRPADGCGSCFHGVSDSARARRRAPRPSPRRAARRSSGRSAPCRRSRRALSTRVVHEALDLRLRSNDFVGRVHEQRTRQRLVAAVLDRLLRRLDAAVAGVDGDQVQLVLVVLVVREAEVAESPVCRRRRPGRARCRPRRAGSRCACRPSRR